VDPTEKSDRPSLSLMAALVGVTSLTPLGQTVLAPALPALAKLFGASYGHTQLLVTVFLVVMAIGQLVYGALSDKWGRRRLLMFGTALFLVGSFASLLAQTMNELLAWRALQAAGGCAGAVLGRAILRDLYPGTKAASALGMLMTMTVLIPLAAPMLGGLITDHISPMAIFVALGLWGGLAGLLVLAFVPETHGRSARGAVAGPILWQYAQVLRSVSFLLPTGTVAFSTSMYFGYMAGAPHLMVDLLGVTATEYGFYLILIAGSFAIGSFGTGMLAARLGTKRLIGAGVVLASSGGIVMFAGFLLGEVTVLMLVGTMSFSSIGHGLLVPNAISRAVGAVPGLFGTASSLAGFLQLGLGAAMTALIGALVAQYPAALGWGVFVTALLSCLCAWGTLRHSEQSGAR
jgi:DHA1 family bicyclomycin/chloramphenicol resistance-like MFS transporter